MYRSWITIGVHQKIWRFFREKWKEGWEEFILIVWTALSFSQHKKGSYSTILPEIDEQKSGRDRLVEKLSKKIKKRILCQIYRLTSFKVSGQNRSKINLS